MVLLGKVKDVIRISGRGVVLVPEFGDSRVRFRVGELIEIRAQKGPIMETRIRGIEHLRPLQEWKPRSIGILLEDDQPALSIGMEIWLNRDE